MEDGQQVLSFFGIGNDASAIDDEFISRGMKLSFIRLLRWKNGNDFLRSIESLNIAHQVLGKVIVEIPLSDESVFYDSITGASVRSMIEGIVAGISAREYFEIVGDFICEGIFTLDEVNKMLEKNDSSVRYYLKDETLKISFSYKEDSADEIDRVANVGTLFNRIESAMERADYAEVLHASASIFETIMRDVMNIPGNKMTFDSMMKNGFKEKSGLPEWVTDQMNKIYIDRGRKPIAAHGAVEEPGLTRRDAMEIVEFTKMVVKMQRDIQVDVSVNARHD